MSDVLKAVRDIKHLLGSLLKMHMHSGFLGYLTQQLLKYSELEFPGHMCLPFTSEKVTAALAPANRKLSIEPLPCKALTFRETGVVPRAIYL